MGVRFFVAARADSPETARKILTEDLKATDKKVRTEGVYNPVLEGISIAERRNYWEKEGSPYEEALEKWRNRFTTVINNVTDETRIAAFKSILPDDPTLKDKTLSEINQDDATKLFKEYSENKSDIDLFMNRAITSLTAQGVLEPAALQAHITHLRWIATGFFGKETASMIDTQILLEVERKKDPFVISEFIDENLDRVNNFGPEEAEVLKVVRQQAVLWEEEKKKQPVGATPTVQPSEPLVQVPAYDDDDFLPAPTENAGTVLPKPAPPPVAERTQAAEPQPAANANPAVTPEPNEPSNPVVENNPTTSPENPSLDKENVVELGTGNRNLIQRLNGKLKQEKSNEVTFAVSPHVLKAYISSIAQDQLLNEGRIGVDKDNNQLTVKGLKIKLPKIGGAVDLDIKITNDPNGGIKVDIQNFKGGLRGGLARGEIEKRLAAINSTIKDRLNTEIQNDNPSWSTDGLSILEDKVHIKFNKPA